jgi:DNA-binding HxlR family transcriptional regulator
VTLGLHRFDELQRDLGVATNVLSERLGRLCDGGVLTRSQYSERPDRYEYTLTEKGQDLVPILLALTAWGDRWESAEAGPPLLIRHHTCGKVTRPTVCCDQCGVALDTDTVDYHPGPGGRAAPGTALLAARLGQ